MSSSRPREAASQSGRKTLVFKFEMTGRRFNGGLLAVSRQRITQPVGRSARYNGVRYWGASFASTFVRPSLILGEGFEHIGCGEYADQLSFLDYG